MTTELPAPLLLYVEDEALIQQMLVTDLEEAGFAVLVTNNVLGREAAAGNGQQVSLRRS